MATVTKSCVDIFQLWMWCPLHTRIFSAMNFFARGLPESLKAKNRYKMICDMDQRQKRATKNAIWVFPWKKICLESLKANIDFMLIKQFVPILQSCPNFTMIIWLHIFCQIFVKFKIAFFSEQPCMERISAKYYNRYFVKFFIENSKVSQHLFSSELHLGCPKTGL